MRSTPNKWPSADDLAFGPGSSAFEKALAWLAGLALAGSVLEQYLQGQMAYPVWKLLLALLIAIDLGAGAIANVLEPCGRFYYSPPTPEEPFLLRLLKKPLFFAALHIYPLLVALVFDPHDWLAGLLGYARRLLASLAVIRAPRRYQRPIAYLATTLAIVFAPSLLPAPSGFAWLLPILFLKIVAGHSVTPEGG